MNAFALQDRRTLQQEPEQKFAGMGGTGEASRPSYYIALRLIGGTLPSCLLLPALLAAIPKLESPARQAIAYQAAMVLTVLLIFSIASAKRDDYILPAIPPLAIMLAALFGGALGAGNSSLKFARNQRDGITGAVALTTCPNVPLLMLPSTAWGPKN